jgi:hypothetical protein
LSIRATSRVDPGVLFLTVLAGVFVSAPLAGLSTQPTAARAQQTPQFRIGADVVPVYATVRDPNRGFVVDLTLDDFELYDDGRKQPITQFTLATQPLSAVVLIDGSGSMIQEFNRALEGARNFVLRMMPDDRVKVGSFADRVVLGAGFTSDRDALLAYLDDQFNIRVGAETHLWEALVESSLALTEESGKRVVVVMSDGYNFVLPPGYATPPQGSSGGYPPTGGRGPASPPTGGIKLPGGLPIPTSPPVRGTPPGSPPRGPVTGRPGSPTPGKPSTPSTPASVAMIDPATYGVRMGDVEAAASIRNVIVYGVSMWVRDTTGASRPSRDLERLALGTGGAFYEVRVSDDMNPVFTEIVQQLRQQYVLGFVPASFDGKRHSLSVRVKRPGLQVQARQSYVATREK